MLSFAIVGDGSPFRRVQVPHDETISIGVLEPALEGDGKVMVADVGQVGGENNIAARVPTKDETTGCTGLVAEVKFKAIQGMTRPPSSGRCWGDTRSKGPKETVGPTRRREGFRLKMALVAGLQRTG